MTKPDAFQFEPIGIIRTCFKDKFGVPRQPGIVKEAKGIIILNDHPFFGQAIKGLEEFSHIWILFLFHLQNSKNWKPSIRPPRLGGAKKVGVLASRSPHRPNPIGLSVVALEKIVSRPRKGTEIHVAGVDLLDGTPVLDVKPYLPYADSLPHANAAWASLPIDIVPVTYSNEALADLEQRSCSHLLPLISEILSCDPRPAFQARKYPLNQLSSQGARFGMKIHHLDVKWEISNSMFKVYEIS